MCTFGDGCWRFVSRLHSPVGPQEEYVWEMVSAQGFQEHLATVVEALERRSRLKKAAGRGKGHSGGNGKSGA